METGTGHKWLQQRLTLRHLRVMLALDEARSFSGAAEVLCISQAAVSKTRSEIEQLIGIPVFEHRKLGWEPTTAGVQIVNAARRIMAELDCLNDEFLMLREGALGSVTVGYRTVSMTASIAAATAEFKTTHPTLTVKLLDGQFVDLMDRMRLGEVDLIISPLPEGWDRREIMSCVIRKRSHVAVASRGHALANRRRLSWADLIDQPWCLTPVGTQTRRHFEAILTEIRLPFPRDVIEANSFLMTMALMKQIPLLGILPTEVPTRLYPDVATVLPVPMFGIGDDVHLIWLSQRAMTPSVRQFRDFLIDRAGAAKIGSRLGGRPARPPALADVARKVG